MTNRRTFAERLLERHAHALKNRDDRGAALMLALVVMFAVSVIVVSIVTWAGNSLSDTAKFIKTASLEYATGAAVQAEVQTLRYGYQASQSTAYNCTPGGTTMTVNSQSVSVWCTVVYNAKSAVTRAITLSSCASNVSSSSCVASPFLQVVVQFNDYANPVSANCIISGGVSNLTSCGTSQTITSWVYG
jgi:hypothetical protein